MAASSLHPPSITVPQPCNGILLAEHERLWTGPPCGHSLTGGSTAAKLDVAAQGNMKGPSAWQRGPEETSRQERKAPLWLKREWVEPKLANFDAQMEVTMNASTSDSIWTNNSGPSRLVGNGGDVTVEICRDLCAQGQLEEAVDALALLVERGGRVSTSLFYNVLKSCLDQKKSLVLGRRVHALAVKGGFESNTFLANHIMRMYASHGCLRDTKKVFSKVETPDTFMWSSIISAHADHGEPKQAIQLYHQMRSSNVKPDGHVFVAALRACASVPDLGSGMQVHTDVLERGLDSNVFVGGCLIDMYNKCGRVEDARQVFDSLPTRNVVSWNSMIYGYAEHGLGQEALALHRKMEQEGMILGNSITFSCLLKACGSIGAMQQGKQLHAQILRRGLEADVVVGSCLVDMYCKCGSLEDARRIFDSLATRNVVTWTTMITGYAKHGLGQEALALYARLEQEGMVVANSVTLGCLLKACESVGALQQGKQLHAQISERGLEGDVVVGSCLVDMYAKCGSLEDARRVFDKLPRRNVITWTAMLNGFGQSNDGQGAIQCFQEMLQDGVQPDETTYLCLLVACSHEGLVKEGRQFFKSMVEHHSIVPTKKHYMCMVDLLARSGHLEEAENLLLSMPLEGDVVGWMSLLNACRSYGDIGRGRRCFESLIRLDPQNPSTYVLMANMYADAGRWTDVERIEMLRKSVGASKKPAKAGIEVNKQVHTFVVGEENNGISLKLRSLNVRLKEGGHVPHTQLVLKPVSEKAKEDELCGHAEKLALAYGLLNTPDGASLLVTKNLRMCSDCHSSTQIMSRIEKREIVVRDAHRVHRFVDGVCCCGDRP